MTPLLTSFHFLQTETGGFRHWIPSGRSSGHQSSPETRDPNAPSTSRDTTAAEVQQRLAEQRLEQPELSGEFPCFQL